MYIEYIKSGDKTQVLLRESFREEGKVKKRTIANLTGRSEEEILAFQFACQNVKKIPEIMANRESANISIAQGKSVGAAFALAEVAKRLGITDALGKENDSKLALWQIFARLIAQGSRLSAVRLHDVHALAEAVNLEQGFSEDHLYQNLAWLADNQDKIEDRLFKFRYGSDRAAANLLLYDVTSSYLEGEYNEFGSYGYNRDGKKGKLQIVVGLVCDRDGWPITIQVFEGNTSDTTTFGDQVRKAVERFGCKRITFVGDRGMIKASQKTDLAEADFNYITALTKKQIETLEKDGAIQLGMFDNNLCEVSKDGIRYILRCNPVRKEEIAASRRSKMNSIEILLKKKASYLTDHPLAKVETATKDINEKIEKLNCKWLTIQTDGRVLKLVQDEEKLTELSRLDGCYVITSDLPADVETAENIHQCYKDLAYVESAFRESKTNHLELRPINVRKKLSTKGHVFVVMLSYLMRMELKRAWRPIDGTVEEGIKALSTLSCVVETKEKFFSINKIPEPTGLCKKLLDALAVKLPKTYVQKNLTVATRKKTKKDTNPV
jgi:transposase